METGYQSFAENFQQCCGESAARLAYERQQTEVEYEVASRECEELYKSIEEKLGGDYKLLNKFDTAKNRLLCFGDEYIYQQGFQDCVYLLRWIGMI